MVNFRDFVWLMGIMCQSDMIDRLKLMYRLHLPPALLDTEQLDPDTPDDSGIEDLHKKITALFLSRIESPLL